MSNYLATVWETIREHSASTNIYDALKEWEWFPGYYYREGRDAEINCQWCSHENIRHIYFIQSNLNGALLEVGCVCILRFLRAANEDADMHHDVDSIEEKMEQEKLDYQRMARKDQLAHYLAAIKRTDPTFPVDITDEKGMTPKQLIWAKKLLDAAGIAYAPSYFKVRLRKYKFYLQMFKPSRKLEIIQYVLPSLTVAQQRSFDWRRFGMEAPDVYRKPKNLND